MSVQFLNFEYWFLNEKRKPVFVPNEKSYEVGYRLKNLVEEATEFDDFYFHMRSGGHIAALHEHRKNIFFARLDLQNFFYSISRHRVARTIHDLGISKAGYYAKASCVKNPYKIPSYSLPYGFVQSPILATVVLHRSVLGEFLRDIQSDVTVSVYMDDVAISASNRKLLESIFEKLMIKVEAANFKISTEKTVAPTNSLELFNCGLESNETYVTEQRRTAFYSTKRTEKSGTAFEKYCQSIKHGNGALAPPRER
jgi:Reverse transcriptase (RNA-dependent DNA polymerase)